MLRLILRTCAGAFAFFVISTAPAYAATLSLTPGSTSVAAGDTVSVQVLVNTSVPIVSSQFQLSYPQELLEPIGFSFAPDWIQTLDSGTNVMANGVVVQAGGRTPALVGTEAMGTLTFKALRPGEATIAIQDMNSFIFQIDGGNLFTGPLASAQIAIGPGSVSANTAAVAAAPVASSSALLNQATSTAAGTSVPWGWLAILLVLAAGFAFIWSRVRAKKRSRRRRR